MSGGWNDDEMLKNNSQLIQFDADIVFAYWRLAFHPE